MTYIEVDPVDGSPDVLEYGLVGHVELPTPHPVLISVIKLNHGKSYQILLKTTTSVNLLPENRERENDRPDACQVLKPSPTLRLTSPCLLTQTTD